MLACTHAFCIWYWLVTTSYIILWRFYEVKPSIHVLRSFLNSLFLQPDSQCCNYIISPPKHTFSSLTADHYLNCSSQNAFGVLMPLHFAFTTYKFNIIRCNWEYINQYVICTKRTKFRTSIFSKTSRRNRSYASRGVSSCLIYTHLNSTFTG